MRVISGIYKHIKLDGYDIDVIRPTMDKVKESMFAMIYEYVNNALCLDLFSGTGSLGIEALSNGAKEVYFVDNNKKSLNITKSNINKLKTDKIVHTILSDYKSILKKFRDEGIKFDIIFLDPPYGQIKIEKLLNKIKELDILNDNGIVVCEYEFEKLDEIYGCLELIKDRKYGKTSLKIYKNRR